MAEILPKVELHTTNAFTYIDGIVRCKSINVPYNVK